MILLCRGECNIFSFEYFMMKKCLDNLIKPNKEPESFMCILSVYIIMQSNGLGSRTEGNHLIYGHYQ